MTTAFLNILNSYGEDAVITGGDAPIMVKAFIQPVTTRRTERTWREMSELGEVDTSRFIAFLPPDVQADAGYTLSVGGTDFEFLKADIFKAHGVASHVEAVLKPREADYIG